MPRSSPLKPRLPHRRGRYLIVCDDYAPDAPFLAEALRRRGIEPADVVTANELTHGARWEHRPVDRRGTAATTVETRDGRVFDSTDVGAVLNRLTTLIDPRSEQHQYEEPFYSAAEFHALVLSWLAGFGNRALNRPSPEGLPGPWRSECAWRVIARAAGLDVAEYVEDGEAAPLPEAASHAPQFQSVLVIDGMASTGVPRRLEEGCRRIADATGLSLFEVLFQERANGQKAFVTLTAFPRLGLASTEALDRLANALRTRAELG